MQKLTMAKIAKTLNKTDIITDNQEVNNIVHKLHEWANSKNILPIADSFSEFYNVNYQNKLYSFGFSYDYEAAWICQTEDDFSLSNNIDYSRASASLESDFITYLTKDQIVKIK